MHTERCYNGSEEFYNSLTGERIFFYYQVTDLNIIVYVSIGKNLSGADMEQVTKVLSSSDVSKPKLSPVKITNIRAKMDYVGGWKFTFDLENRSNKTIKYVSVYWHCLNAVGDIVYDQIDFSDRFSGRITGPINPGEKLTDLQNERPFYNSTFANVLDFIEIVVEYMDGSVEVVSPTSYYDYWDLG